MFTVKFINDEDGGKLGEFSSIEAAKNFCRETFANGDIDEADKLQIWGDDSDTAVEEFVASDFE